MLVLCSEPTSPLFHTPLTQFAIMTWMKACRMSAYGSAGLVVVAGPIPRGAVVAVGAIPREAVVVGAVPLGAVSVGAVLHREQSIGATKGSAHLSLTAVVVGAAVGVGAATS